MSVACHAQMCRRVRRPDGGAESLRVLRGRASLGPIRRGDRGQATVEWAILFPLVVMAALLVLQVALVGRERVLLVHKCRAAARVTAVQPVVAEAQAAADAAGGGAAAMIEFVGGVAPGQIATVACTETVDTDVPIIGELIPSVSFEERLSVYVEPE